MIRYVYPLLVLVGLFVTPANAQNSVNAYFTADQVEVLAGEPIRLTLTAEVLPGADITGWPEFSESWEPFTVLEQSERTVQENGDMRIYRQTLTVVLWRTGDFQTPQTLIMYRTPDLEGDEDDLEEDEDDYED